MSKTKAQSIIKGLTIQPRLCMRAVAIVLNLVNIYLKQVVKPTSKTKVATQHSISLQATVFKNVLNCYSTQLVLTQSLMNKTMMVILLSIELCLCGKKLLLKCLKKKAELWTLSNGQVNGDLLFIFNVKTVELKQQPLNSVLFWCALCKLKE